MDRPHGAHRDADALFVRHRYRRPHFDYRRDGSPPWICRDDRRSRDPTGNCDFVSSFYAAVVPRPAVKGRSRNLSRNVYLFVCVTSPRIDTNFVPDLGVTIAGIAVAVSLILLLVYLNRFTHALRPVAVAAMVEQAGERVFDQWQQILARQRVNSNHTASEFDATAAPHDCLMVLGHTAGDFVAPRRRLR